MDDLKGTVSNLVKKQQGLFSFLLSPESYLLGAGVLSGMAAAPFLILNVIAFHCVATSCPILQEESNSLASWLVFETLTGFFVVSCVWSLLNYFKVKKEHSG